MTAPHALDVEEVSYRAAEGRVLLDGVRLRAAPGETVGVVGPNGSGKTTLLRCVYGTLRPTGGRITLGGHDAAALSVKARARRV
ncbi:histidinol phosphatase, partial [Streptomyces nanshensis]